MGSGEAASGLILHGSDQKELASKRPEIVSLIERRRLSFSSQQTKANDFARRSSRANNKNDKKKKG
jgi:hypothetical protein